MGWREGTNRGRSRGPQTTAARLSKRLGVPDDVSRVEKDLSFFAALLMNTSVCHCEGGWPTVAIQMDCFVAALLAMTCRNDVHRRKPREPRRFYWGSQNDKP